MSDLSKISTSGASAALVIGAGPAGLAVGGCLRQAGVECIILERADKVGAAWEKHYDRLHLHTAKRFSALPFMPYPADYPRYPSRLQFREYLEAYAKQFQLKICLGQEVRSVEYRDGVWNVSTQNNRYTAHSLVIATGYNQKPTIPTWPDQELFQGTLLHSSDYRNGAPFAGQSVLVVGFGNSGGEIAIDLWEHGAKPAIAVRSPVNVIFRDRFGIPAQALSIALSPLPPRVIDVLTAPAIQLSFGDLSRYGLRKPPYGAATQVATQARIPVIDVGVIKLIKAGQVKVYPGIEKFTERGVIFTDGTQHAFDTILLATGYHVDFSFLGAEAVRVTDSRGYPVCSGQQSSLPNLYFCGFHNSATGLLRQINSEARAIGRAIKAHTPSAKREG